MLIAYFELLRTHGSGLYEVLERSWKCSCSAPHNANLRLEAPKTVQQSLTFHVAFSFPMHSSDDEAPKEVWKETMITLVEEVQGFQNPANRVESMTTLISSQLSMTESKSEFRQLQSNTDDPEPPMAKSQSKTRKLLRFLSQKDQLLAMEAPLGIPYYYFLGLALT